MAPLTRKRAAEKMEAEETKPKAPVMGPLKQNSKTSSSSSSSSSIIAKEKARKSSTKGMPKVEQEKPKVENEQSNSCNQTDVASSMMLTKHLLLKDKDRNVVFSPLSIQLILALLAAGSQGQVLEQLLSFLNAQTLDQLNSWASHIIDTVFSSPSDHYYRPCLSLANGVWIDKSISFKHFFNKVVKDVYKAASNVLDFKNRPDEAVDILNTWVEEKTNGLVKDMVPPDLFNNPDETKIVFANAIYFKATWAERFYEWETKTLDFHLLNDKHVRVPFMTGDRYHQYVDSFNGFKVLKLPYRCSKTAMYIFLPDAIHGLPTLVDKLCSEPGFLERHIPHKIIPLDTFWIPKFKISFGFEASETLKELGVEAPFIRGGGGELDKMVKSKKNEWLYVSDILQKSTIEVNESGTEASAAAILSMRGGGCPPPTLMDFVANHPFLFLIREDETGVVLFIGHVINPLAT